MWIPSLKEEIGNFDSNQAIQRVSEEEAMCLVKEAEDKGQRAEIIPGMGVFTRKAGDGRRRARIVCCGNHMESRTGEEVYASGADATQLRSTLRVASLRDWQCLSLDVKSAFLLAPKAQGELVIVKPLKILAEAALAQPDEHWVITSAMYGLVTSPKDWSVYRDSELQKMEGRVTTQVKEKVMKEVGFGFRQLEDANLWAIQEFSSSSGARSWGAVLGYMIVYVDDVLMVGPKEVTDQASQMIQRVWETSNPEYAVPGGAPMRFLGIEIQRFKDGMYYLHQGSYVREVLERHGGGGTMPFIKVPKKKEEGSPSLARVKEAQKITVELLWLSGRTRPDISWAVMKMSQWAVKRPVWTLELGEAILAYVRGTMDFGLHYPIGVPVDSDPELARSKQRGPGTIEVLVDASFRSGDSHSVSGSIILLAGCPIQWESKKQGLMALSTAEAELSALIEGLQSGRSTRALVELLLEEVTLELYNDNRAAVILASGTGGGWRTRHLRIRAHCLAEAIKVGEVSLNHRAGSSLWADALTKSLPPSSLEKFCQGVFLRLISNGPTVEKKVLANEEVGRVSRCMAMMLTGASLLPVGGASEVCEKGDADQAPGGSMFGDLGWFVFLAGLVCLLHIVKDFGVSMIQRLMSGREEVKVKLLSEEAVMPSKGSEGAAGWDLCASMQCHLAPGERRLISTGVAVEIPRGCYGRIASRSSMASQGIDVAGGVVDADYRGELKVIMVNQGGESRTFNVGDRIAQLVVERISLAPFVKVDDLSTTARGFQGFGSSGIAVKSVREASGGLHREGELLHEGGLHDRGLPGHERGSSSGGEGLLRVRESGRVITSGRVPSSIFFETFTSRGGETMQEFLRRLREGELQCFAWLFADSVLRFVGEMPLSGAPHEVMVVFPGSIVTMKIHRHATWRKKLYDSGMSTPPASQGVASAVITLAWLEDGRKVVRSDARKGSHGMHYLQQRWMGYSILFRVSDISETAAGDGTGSC